jgi:hypothetical protein
LFWLLHFPLQLVKDRKDVVQYLTSDISARIRAMPPAVALAVLGALNDLPRVWAAKHKKPVVELAAVAARAEVYAREQHGSSNGSAAAAGGDEYGSGDDGWVTAGQRGSAGGLESSSSSSNGLVVGSSGAAGAATGGTAAALWKQLQAQRPDVWRGLQERHKALIKPLTQEQQKKVGDVTAACVSNSAGVLLCCWSVGCAFASHHARFQQTPQPQLAVRHVLCLHGPVPDHLNSCWRLA